MVTIFYFLLCIVVSMSIHFPFVAQAIAAELHLFGLVTGEERVGDLSDVIRIQAGKSPSKMIKTAEILRKHGLIRESDYLKGNYVPAFCV